MVVLSIFFVRMNNGELVVTQGPADVFNNVTFVAEKMYFFT